MQCISFSLMFSVHRLCYLLLFFSLRVLGLARFRIDDSFLGENGCLMVQALVDSEGRFVDISTVWPITMNPETI
ncbi:hypothetical protein LR48_Vigan08g085000 [Vigna angularis]|uniref:Uncharacterized protein n=2 Tax=Phaseolus angularis TaxID=3914 RepID=A0A0S3SAR3_PHAAN|nr:hypothetical protein LR48_Vigan08g085000 [Vigna angularis]BAT80585.1 hypothetical protein VIGAN_03017600 [Vigna angularis var. angularis]BAT89956.1 hypothetical protein VIGAN_06109900 [Vigna angularis var. angularis]